MPDIPIPFTQYLMPHGQRKAVLIDRSQDVAERATQLQEAGCVFEIEMLSDYITISMTVERGKDVLAIAVVPNGPAVPEAVDQIINEAHARVFPAAENNC